MPTDRADNIQRAMLGGLDVDPCMSTENQGQGVPTPYKLRGILLDVLVRMLPVFLKLGCILNVSQNHF